MNLYHFKHAKRCTHLTLSGFYVASLNVDWGVAEQCLTEQEELNKILEAY